MNIGNLNRLAPPAGGDPGMDGGRAGAQPVRPEGAPPASAAPAARETAPVERSQREARALREQAELSRASAEKLVERIGEQLRIERRSLSFTIDDELGKTIVKVIDRETDEVIRQIPSDELLRFAEVINAINEQRAAGVDTGPGTGLLIQEQA